MTNEAGYTTKAPSPRQLTKGPISLPEYYNEHSHRTHQLNHLSQQGDLYDYDPSTPKVYAHLPPVSPNHSHIMTHAVGDGRQPHLLTFVHSPYEMYGGQMPHGSEEFSIVGDEEAESSPEYESEVDDISSNEIPSPRSASCNVHRETTQRQEDQHQLEQSVHNQAGRQDSSNTAVSGEKSDDTMWEREQTTTQAVTAMTPAAALAAETRAVAVSTTGSLLGTTDSGIPGTRPPSPQPPSSYSPPLRRHSDTLFVPPNHKAVLRPNSGSLPTSENGHMQGLYERRPSLRREVDRRKQRESTSVGLQPVALHPYVSQVFSCLQELSGCLILLFRS